MGNRTLTISGSQSITHNQNQNQITATPQNNNNNDPHFLLHKQTEAMKEAAKILQDTIHDTTQNGSYSVSIARPNNSNIINPPENWNNGIQTVKKNEIIFQTNSNTNFGQNSQMSNLNKNSHSINNNNNSNQNK